MTAPTEKREAPTPATKQEVGWVAACVLLSWFGLFLHNRADLPHLPVLSPESSIPALISLLLFLGWWLLPAKRTMRAALLSWVLLNLLVGGILSVLPLPFWPFHPEQTVFHYLMHAQYILTQIPLIVILLQQARRSASGKRRRV